MLACTATDIGLIIRERRRKLHLDQEELARRVKVSRQWIVEVEKGKPRAEIGLILRTLETLGLALSIDTGLQPGTERADVIPPVDIDAIINELGPNRT